VNGEIARELDRWRDFIDYEQPDYLADRAADLMANGSVLGWVQGRSEFGPRALGNRSIVADPRPASHKDLINAMIKKREAFRPFAPSVLEEDAEQFFELPPCQKRFPYMVFVVTVREEYRALLGAVTHVDGTARIQTVSRATNERYWELIHAFGERTGVPILLNTSFNNNAEPIVNTASDALVTYLTTDLHAVVIGDYLVTKKPIDRGAFAALQPSLPGYVRLQHVPVRGPRTPEPEESSDVPFFKQLFQWLRKGDPDSDFFLSNTHGKRKATISEAMASVLVAADGYTTLDTLIQGCDAPERARLLDEALDLWRRRLIRLMPAS
jgi:carbamoyltransferase